MIQHTVTTVFDQLRNNIGNQISTNLKSNEFTANSMINDYICGTDSSMARIFGGGMNSFYALSGCKEVVQHIGIRSQVLLSNLEKSKDATNNLEANIKREAEDATNNLEAVIKKEAFYRLVKINLSLLVINHFLTHKGVTDLISILDPKVISENMNSLGAFAKSNPLALAIIVGTVLAVEYCVYSHINNKAIEYADNVAIKDMIKWKQENIEQNLQNGQVAQAQIAN